MTEEEDMEIMRCAGTHIGFFLTWIIKHHYESEASLEYASDALEAVRREEMLGVDYFREYCDGKFDSDIISKEILPFVAYYYKKYLSVYKDWVTNSLHKTPFGFIGTWEDYHKLEYILDEAYALFCSQNTV